MVRVCTHSGSHENKYNFVSQTRIELFKDQYSSSSDYNDGTITQKLCKELNNHIRATDIDRKNQEEPLIG